MRYVFAGSLGAGVYYVLFSLGWLALARWVPYLVLAVAASTMTAIITYPVYRNVVFRTGGPILRGFLRFYVVCLWAMFFNVAGLAALVELVRLPVLVAQAIVLVVGPVINYQAGRLWAFRQREEIHAQ